PRDPRWWMQSPCPMLHQSGAAAPTAPCDEQSPAAKLTPTRVPGTKGPGAKRRETRRSRGLRPAPRPVPGAAASGIVLRDAARTTFAWQADRRRRSVRSTFHPKFPMPLGAEAMRRPIPLGQRLQSWTSPIITSRWSKSSTKKWQQQRPFASHFVVKNRLPSLSLSHAADFLVSKATFDSKPARRHKLRVPLHLSILQSIEQPSAPSHHLVAWGQTSDWRRYANPQFQPGKQDPFVPESKWRREEPRFSQTQLDATV